jgi:hypothetical protein
MTDGGHNGTSPLFDFGARIEQLKLMKTRREDATATKKRETLISDRHHDSTAVTGEHGIKERLPEATQRRSIQAHGNKKTETDSSMEEQDSASRVRRASTKVSMKHSTTGVVDQRS